MPTLLHTLYCAPLRRQVKYNYKLVMILEGTQSGGTMPQTLFFSTIAPLNSMCQESLRIPVLRTQEVDGDMDGKAERLEISAMVPIANGEAIYSAKVRTNALKFTTVDNPPTSVGSQLA